MSSKSETTAKDVGGVFPTPNQIAQAVAKEMIKDMDAPFRAMLVPMFELVSKDADVKRLLRLLDDLNPAKAEAFIKSLATDPERFMSYSTHIKHTADVVDRNLPSLDQEKGAEVRAHLDDLAKSLSTHLGAMLGSYDLGTSDVLKLLEWIQKEIDEIAPEILAPLHPIVELIDVRVLDDVLGKLTGGLEGAPPSGPDAGGLTYNRDALLAAADVLSIFIRIFDWMQRTFPFAVSGKIQGGVAAAVFGSAGASLKVFDASSFLIGAVNTVLKIFRDIVTNEMFSYGKDKEPSSAAA